MHDIVIGRPGRALDRSVNPRDLEVSIPSVGSSSKQNVTCPTASHPASVCPPLLVVAMHHAGMSSASCVRSIRRTCREAIRKSAGAAYSIHHQLHELRRHNPRRSTDNGRVQRGRASDFPLQKRQLAASVATHGSVSFGVGFDCLASQFTDDPTDN